MKIFLIILTSLLLSFWGCSSKQIQNINISEINYPKNLKIITRSNWGWRKLEKEKPIHKIKYITLHHGGEKFAKDKNVVKYLQNLQSWSREEKKWIDIPYHFMIDLYGNIYETRPIDYAGDTNTKYDPTGHALICVMGNYEVQKINDVQLYAVANLCAFLCKKYNVSVEKIKSHKDYTETLCPGKDFYKYINDGSLLKSISDILISNSNDFYY